MNTAQRPRVTIGLPTWNRLAYLRAALDSARAQTYPDLEIVVSDNASTDGTDDYLQSLSDSRLVKLRQTRNIGGIPNLNACLDHASGDLFLLLSDDDLLDPSAIEALAAPFSQPPANCTPDVGLSWCNCRIIDAAGEMQWTTATGPECEGSVAFLTEVFSGNRGPRLSSVMVRTDDARRAGGYNLERYNAMCDTANWGAACLSHASVVCIPRLLASYRVHTSSHTSSSLAADWQRWGAHMHEDLLTLVRQYATPAQARRFAETRNPLLANLTVDVLMRSRGTPGCKRRSLRELWRSREYLLTPYCFRRLLRDGRKLLRKRERLQSGTSAPLKHYS
jgi:glycosyltransferase involved in cell wall biosynthesis